MNEKNDSLKGKILKSERGSISLYALIGMLILLTILLGTYIYYSQKYIQSLEVSEQIKAEYEKDYEDIAQVYSNIAQLDSNY